MQAIMETAFDILYLVGVIVLGIIMVRNRKKNRVLGLYGCMAILLGAGDAFHLVPRMVALWGTGLEAHAVSLGIGKLVTSVTMTLFYAMLYIVWRKWFQIKDRQSLTVLVWVLAGLRIALCAFPQNEWTSYHQPLFWGIVRNIPFAFLGLVILLLYWQENKKSGGSPFQMMPLAIILSFAFYIPVVLFAESYPLVGMLMIPKTLAYVWIVWMGFSLVLQKQKKDD